MCFYSIQRTFFTLLIILAGFSVVNGQVEEELNLKLLKGTYLQETLDSSGIGPYLVFPHLNEAGFYKDAKKLKSIGLAEKNGNLARLDTLLTEYLSNFRIENFKKDIDMVWLTGQTKEKNGDTLQSMLYYEVGLNHQRSKGRMQSRYDSLNARWASTWVDLEFYYRLLKARRKINPLIPPAGVLLNMGNKVNSDFPEYGPFMHPADSVLIFTSRRDEEIIIDDIHGEQNEDLYFLQRDYADGAWNFAERFSDSINSIFNEGSACLSRNGKTLFFTRCNSDEGEGNCDIYTAEYKGSQWVNVKNLGEKVNSSYWDSQPNLTPDGKVLLFASNRPGGFGGSDIWISVWQEEDSAWSQALNLGPRINTLDQERTPFFHEINKTLYFSSRGHLNNVGGFDIFKSRWHDDHWGFPKNLGPLVNSTGNEYYFSIDGKGEKLFYAKAKAKEQNIEELKQNFDLFSFKMPMEARPDAIYSLKGYLIDSVTNKPLRGVVLVLDKTSEIEIAPKEINKYGYFEFDLANDHYYEIFIIGENYLTVKKEVDLTTDTTFTAMAESFAYDKPFVFEVFQFEENSHDLDRTIEPKLEYISQFMKKYPMFALRISGHTDADGPAEYNLQLSRKRALKIRKYMTTKGKIEGKRVEASGFGEIRPLLPNTTASNKRLNRRVEFELYIDPNYKGDLFLPTDEEMEFEEIDIFDPDFMDPLEDFEEDFEDDSGFDWDMDVEVEIDREADKEFLEEVDEIEIESDLKEFDFDASSGGKESKETSDDD